MTRTANADQFWQGLAQLRRSYEELRKRLLGELRLRLAKTPDGEKRPVEEAEGQALEAHARRYFVDHFLELLNWRLGRPSSDVHEAVPEAPVYSPGSKTIRFLDYLGYDTKSLRPLLIVETKRPSAALKSLIPRARIVTANKIAAELVRRVNESDFSGEWGEWLNDVRDYAAGVSVEGDVRRVVITNGEWLLVWKRPQALAPDASASLGDVAVFLDAKELESRYGEVFELLEHSRVLGSYASVNPGLLPQIVAPDSVESAMKGALVARIDHESLLTVQPTIWIMPVLFLLSRDGAWITIRGPQKEFSVPHDYAELPAHVAAVESAAKLLHEEVCRVLTRAIPLRPLLAHFAADSGFEALPAVSRWGAWAHSGPEKYTVATGDVGHFFCAETRTPGCPYHSWANAKRDGVADGAGPQVTRSADPNSFFVDGEGHRCFHSYVVSAKSAAVPERYHPTRGWRSASPGGAFCELWRVETGLCCHACSFLAVCASAEVFRLPCEAH